jgi:hypothetical protein
MEFRPIINRDPAIMDKRIFLPEAMGLRDDLLRMPLEQRFTYHPEKNQFFVNFEGHVVRSQQDIERIRHIVETMLASARRKVHVIVNYDNFSIYPTSLMSIPRWSGMLSIGSIPESLLHDQRFSAHEARRCIQSTIGRAAHLRKRSGGAGAFVRPGRKACADTEYGCVDGKAC